MLVEKILSAYPGGRVYVVAQDKSFWRVPRAFKRRVEYLPVQSPLDYTDRLAEVSRIRPSILIIDWLNAQTVSLALELGGAGTRVISQLETIFTGPGVARLLIDLGAQPGQLNGLAGVFSVQRMARLCPACKQPVLPSPDQIARLQVYYPDLADLLRQDSPLRHDHHEGFIPTSSKRISSHLSGESEPTPTAGEIGTFYQSGSCPTCHQTGRHGDISAFDIFIPESAQVECLDQSSQLALETYLLYLASMGEVALSDFVDFHPEHFRRAFLLLQASEHRLEKTQAAYERKLLTGAATGFARAAPASFRPGDCPIHHYQQ
jgi:hypothetical protein